MTREFDDIFTELALPFEPWEVKTRLQAGRELNYVTVRTVMNRLDEVIGPWKWTDEYLPGANSVTCRLTITLPDGSTVTKADAGGYAGMSDQGDDDKSGFSDALKRAAAKFGIGRYLYGDGVPRFARSAFSEREVEIHNPQPSKPAPRVDPPKPERNGTPHRPIAPPAPAPAPAPEPEPDREPGDETQQVVTERSTVGQRFKDRVVARATEVRYPGLLNAVAKWGQTQGFPTRIQDWSADQVSMAAARAKDLVVDHERAQINGRAKELAHS